MAMNFCAFHVETASYSGSRPLHFNRCSIRLLDYDRKVACVKFYRPFVPFFRTIGKLSENLLSMPSSSRWQKSHAADEDLKGPRMFSVPMIDSSSDSESSMSSTEVAMRYLCSVRKEAEARPKAVVADDLPPAQSPLTLSKAGPLASLPPS